LRALSLFAGIIMLRRWLGWRPDASLRGSDDAPTFDPSAGPLKVLVWNIQFCGSTAHHFFYEGGTQVCVDGARRS